MITLLMYFGEVFLVLCYLVFFMGGIPKSAEFILTMQVVLFYLWCVFLFVINKYIIEFHDWEIRKDTIRICALYEIKNHPSLSDQEIQRRDWEREQWERIDKEDKEIENG